MKRLTISVLMMLAMAVTGGCALGLAAGGGAVAADEYDEAKECGDDFDPLENARDEEDGCN